MFPNDPAYELYCQERPVVQAPRPTLALRQERHKGTEGLCSALPPVLTLAPQPPDCPPEANLEFPGQEEEPPSSLEEGGAGFPGILLHNGPALSRKAHQDEHWGPPEAQVGHQALQRTTPFWQPPPHSLSALCFQ